MSFAGEAHYGPNTHEVAGVGEEQKQLTPAVSNVNVQTKNLPKEKVVRSITPKPNVNGAPQLINPFYSRCCCLFRINMAVDMHLSACTLAQ